MPRPIIHYPSWNFQNTLRIGSIASTRVFIIVIARRKMRRRRRVIDERGLINAGSGHDDVGIAAATRKRREGCRGRGRELLYQRHNYAVTPSGEAAPGLDRLAKIFEVSLAPNQAFSPPYCRRVAAPEALNPVNFAFSRSPR